MDTAFPPPREKSGPGYEAMNKCVVCQFIINHSVYFIIFYIRSLLLNHLDQSSANLLKPSLLFAVFGFNQTEFRGLEREERYAVEVGFLSGGSPSVVVATISLNLGTAGNNNKYHHKFYVYMSLIIAI